MCNDTNYLMEHVKNLEKRISDLEAGKPVDWFASVQIGLYRLFWVDGGDSLAAVGVDRAGKHWFAPTNWVGGIVGRDWGTIDRVERIA